jgi:uncharacterized iron-regulated membrane protein
MVVLEAAPTTMTENATALRFRFFWRVHFWAAVITAPIVLFASFTGLLYVFTPQIEAWKHGALDFVNATGNQQSLDAQLQAARLALPNLAVRSIIPAYDATQSTQIIFGEVKARASVVVPAKATPKVVETGADEHAQHQGKNRQPTASAMAGHGMPDGKIAYVNPYTATVLGSHDEMDRFNNWARKLHSTALQGDGWRWVLELGASWLLVMLGTGIYLWWPKSKLRGGRGLSALWPRARNMPNARLAWREWHSLIGLAASAMLLIVLFTGLTWSKYTGANFRDALKALGQAAPRAPAKLESVALNANAAADGVLTVAQIYALTSAAAPNVRLQLTPPRDAVDVWRVANFDRNQPTARVQMMLDQYSGKVLFQAGWDVLPLGAKATGAGIPFHRGEFGWWNQALLIFAALAAIFSVVSGFAMWWQRRPAKSIAAPKVAWRHIRAVPFWIWLLACALSFAMPVFGISVLIFVSLEVLRLLLVRDSMRGELQG